MPSSHSIVTAIGLLLDLWSCVRTRCARFNGFMLTVWRRKSPAENSGSAGIVGKVGRKGEKKRSSTGICDHTFKLFHSNTIYFSACPNLC